MILNVPLPLQPGTTAPQGPPTGDPEEEETPQLPPLYVTEFVVEPHQLLFNPDQDEFQTGLGDVMRHFQDTVLRVLNLVPDTYFDAFTRSVDTQKL